MAEISNRSKGIIQSEIRNMSIECDKVGGINLSQGICDLETPLIVKEGAKKAIDSGVNHYTRYDGLPELRVAIAEKLHKFNKMRVNPEKNIVVSGGTTGAFYCACMALLNPGDEVIVFEPYYGYHVSTLLAVGAVPKYAKLTPPKWRFDMQELDGLITEKTRGIMINTPANPCGKVFSREELEQLAEFAERYDLFIFTDEIYEYFVYDSREHISPISVIGAGKRAVMIAGYSKTFSTTGWRIGYVVCDEKWKDTIGYINDLIYVCGPAPLQIGVAEGIKNLNDEFYENIRREYQSKRDTLCRVLQTKGLTPYVPQGAYYVLADVSKLPGNTSKEKAMYLLKETGVAGVPGSAFYHDEDSGDGKNLIRFCFAKKDTELKEACWRLERLEI